MPLESFASYRQTFNSKLSHLYDKAECREIFLQTVEHITAKSRTSITAFSDTLLSEDECSRMNVILERLITGEPLQYITGSAEFYSMQLFIRPGVLIPRPETEEMVALAIKLLRENALRHPKIIDAGTGSGCIALALAKEFHEASVIASDISETALRLASANAKKLRLNIRPYKADMLCSDAFDAFPGTDLIISNPPYIPRSEFDQLHVNVKQFEPAEALFVADDDPLLFYRMLAGHAKKILSPRGILLCETHHISSQGLQLLVPEGFSAQLLPDLSGKARFWLMRKLSKK